MTRTRRRSAGAALTLTLLWLTTACGGSPDPPATSASGAAPSASEEQRSDTQAPAVTSPTETPAPAVTMVPGPVHDAQGLPFDAVLDGGPDDGTDTGPVAAQRLRNEMPYDPHQFHLSGSEVLTYADLVADQVNGTEYSFGMVRQTVDCLQQHGLVAARGFVGLDYEKASIMLISEEGQGMMAAGRMPYCLVIQSAPDGRCVEQDVFRREVEGRQTRYYFSIVGTDADSCQELRARLEQTGPDAPGS